MRPPRIRLISTFPKLVLLSAHLSLIFLLHEMSSLVSVIKLSWGAGEDVQAVSGQHLEAALRMGCRIRPRASPKACPAGNGAGNGVNLTRYEGTGQSSLQKCTCTSKHCMAESPSTPRAAQLEECAIMFAQHYLFQWVLKTAKNN